MQCDGHRSNSSKSYSETATQAYGNAETQTYDGVMIGADKRVQSQKSLSYLKLPIAGLYLGLISDSDKPVMKKSFRFFAAEQWKR